jgi:hypothetical protein
MSNFFNPVSGEGLSGGLLSLFDASYTSGLLVPHYLRTLKNKYGDNGLSDFQLLMGLGMKRGVQNTTGWHWEKGFYDTAISGVVDTTGASQVVITVTSQTVNSTYIDEIYAKIGQVVMFASETTLPLGRISNVVKTSNVGADTFDVTVDAVTTGTLSVFSALDPVTMIVVGSAWAEGTDQPTSSQSFWQKYEWTTQIFKETYELTGTQKTNAPQWMEIEYGDMGTKKMNGFFYEGQDEAEYRLIKQIALSLIWGKQTNNSAVPQTSTGLDYEISQRGYNHTIAGGSFGVDDLRAIATEMSKRYSSNLFLTWLTQELYSELNVDAQGTGYFANANVNALNQSLADVFFGGQMNDVDALTGSLSYQGLIVDGYNFLIKQARFMQDPTTMGAVSTSTLRDRGWVIPLNKMADAEGVLRNRIELIYKEMNGYSRFMEITDDGRASARKIGSTDVARLYLSSDLGFDFFTLEQFTRIIPA